MILSLPGRVSTSTAAGASLALDASTHTYSEGLELRYHIADWADVATWTDAIGMYLRMESREANASGNVYGAQVFGVHNNVASSANVWGGLFYAYVKGSTAATITGLYAIQPELTFDAGASAHTISEAACVRAKVTGGAMAAYTNLHGYKLIAGDMDGGSRTYGNAFWVVDDGDMSGTSAWTRGLYLNSNCTTGIAYNGTFTNALDFSSVTGSTNTDGSLIKAGTLSVPVALNTAGQYGIAAFVSSTATSGSVTCARFRALANAASGGVGAFGILAQASTIASKRASDVVPISAESILKASSVIGANWVVGGQFKIEDDPATSGSGTSPTNGATNAVLRLMTNISSDPTGGLYILYVDAQSASGGTGVQAPDAFVKFENGGQNQAIVNFLDAPATGGCFDTTASVGSQVGRILVNWAGTQRAIPVYALS